jgi:hypothetical protein
VLFGSEIGADAHVHHSYFPLSGAVVAGHLMLWQHTRFSAKNSAPVFVGLSKVHHRPSKRGLCVLLFSGTSLEEFLKFPGLSGRKICSDSHFH